MLRPLTKLIFKAMNTASLTFIIAKVINKIIFLNIVNLNFKSDSIKKLKLTTDSIKEGFEKKC
ncbi:hypothetical protein LCR01_18480 [Companilactobacillus crustorum]|uniref:Uncharacterized protein n=1 Tax=Companilactobacillus crustorum TaxID=392416 RepID=A0AB34ADA3_9LACO|nr:hypothetical protein LCR01_18480 [Companilactobacillus crustorum]